MMKVVIDISEEDYNNIEPFLNGETIKGGFNLFKVLEIIKNGTPVPKGHGKIIDADYTIKQLLSLPKNELSTEDMWAVKVLELAPTIIEADKENTDEEN